MKKIFSHPNFWPIIIVLFFALLAGRTLLTQGYFNMHDDLQMMRQFEMEKCFKDFQIPCRWVTDMGFGYGFPLFNFYPPLPYLIGELVRVMGFSFVDTAKIVFLLSFLVSGVTMYFLSKEFFGRFGGIISSIFYVWAPYHSVDVYVRGAMNEAWALAWFPLILWTGYKLIVAEKKEIKKWIIALALSWAGLLLSHNLMVLIFTPVFAGWCLIFLFKRKKLIFNITHLVFSGLLALGMSAFFTLPSILEQKFVHVDTLVMGYYEYVAHFATISQLLFSRFWGYGASIWEQKDGMPFQIGHIHWILSLVILGFIIFRYFKTKKFENWLLVVGFFFLVGWLAAFMTHSKSIFIWLAIPPLKFVQFPWRFLTLVILSFSFIAGSLPIFLKPFSRLRIIIPSFLIVLLVIINWDYFLPQHGKMGPLTDQQKFSGAAWDLQRTAGIFDYLPKSAKENPKEGQNFLTEIITGKADISEQNQGTNWAKFKVIGSQETVIRVGIFQFPNWKVFIDGRQSKIEIPDTEKWGRIYITVPSGEHEVYLKLENTPIRTISNLVSIFVWLGLLAVLHFKRGRSKS